MDPGLVGLGLVIAGFSAGFYFRRMAVVFAIALLGGIAIIVDVSTRDLTGAGHDSTWLVAGTEIVALLLACLAAAVGIASRRTRR